MIIEKITLQVGKKKIELTPAEYDELKQHFAGKEYVPYPYPVYPQWPNTPQPIPIWYDTTSSPNFITGTVTANINHGENIFNE